MHLKGKDIHVEATSTDMYAALDALADKLDRQVLKLQGKDHRSPLGRKRARPGDRRSLILLPARLLRAAPPCRRPSPRCPPAVIPVCFAHDAAPAPWANIVALLVQVSADRPALVRRLPARSNQRRMMRDSVKAWSRNESDCQNPVSEHVLFDLDVSSKSGC